MRNRNKRNILQKLLYKWDAKILSVILAIICVLLYRFSSLDTRNFSIPLNILINDSFVAVGSFPQKISVTIRGNEELIYSVLEEDLEAYVGRGI